MRRVLHACRRRCHGAFRAEAAFEGFAHQFSQEHPSDEIGRRESVRLKCADAWRRPVVGGEDAELFVGEASRRGGVRSGGVGVCCEESASDASECIGLIASLRDEAVAGVVIVCPSTQQPCGYSTSVKRYVGAYADGGGDFRDSVGPADVPRRCEQSQRKVW